jgi:hypothetical protein
MTDKQTPPDWAFERVQDLRQKRGFTYLDAFAAYIAEHEQPPVDRKLLCAREAVAQLFVGEPEETEARSGHRDEYDHVVCATRAIELWEEGFGK